MAADANQDFVTYQGDDIAPIFFVHDSANAAVDISSVTEITWTAQRNEDDSVLLTKTKSAGQISFVTDGTDGRFQVAITKTDTAPLTGWYLHKASITDAVGNVTTVTVGRMQVGVKSTWSYDPTQIATSNLYQVRRLIGDVKPSEQQLYDAEINLRISQYSTVDSAAAACCRDIAAGYSREVDLVQGELKTNYSNRAKAYLALADRLEQRGLITSGTGYAGGISITDKMNQNTDTDRVPPQFNIGMDDNRLPVASVGNEVPIPPLAEVDWT